jgi:hypothetical protein
MTLQRFGDAAAAKVLQEHLVWLTVADLDELHVKQQKILEKVLSKSLYSPQSAEN